MSLLVAERLELLGREVSAVYEALAYAAPPPTTPATGVAPASVAAASTSRISKHLDDIIAELISTSSQWSNAQAATAARDSRRHTGSSWSPFARMSRGRNVFSVTRTHATSSASAQALYQLLRILDKLQGVQNEWQSLHEDPQTTGSSSTRQKVAVTNQPQLERHQQREGQQQHQQLLRIRMEIIESHIVARLAIQMYAIMLDTFIANATHCGRDMYYWTERLHSDLRALYYFVSSLPGRFFNILAPASSNFRLYLTQHNPRNSSKDNASRDRDVHAHENVDEDGHEDTQTLRRRPVALISSLFPTFSVTSTFSISSVSELYKREIRQKRRKLANTRQSLAEAIGKLVVLNDGVTCVSARAADSQRADAPSLYGDSSFFQHRDVGGINKDCKEETQRHRQNYQPRQQVPGAHQPSGEHRENSHDSWTTSQHIDIFSPESSGLLESSNSTDANYMMSRTNPEEPSSQSSAVPQRTTPPPRLDGSPSLEDFARSLSDVQLPQSVANRVEAELDAEGPADLASADPVATKIEALSSALQEANEPIHRLIQILDNVMSQAEKVVHAKRGRPHRRLENGDKDDFKSISNTADATKTSPLGMRIASGMSIDIPPSSATRTMELLGLANRLEKYIKSSVPNMISTYGRPSALTHWWLPAFGSLIATRCLVNAYHLHREELYALGQNARDTCIMLVRDWIYQPVVRIYHTIRHQERRLQLVGARSLESDLESLERMVIAFARDNALVSESDIAKLLAQVQSGDLSIILEAYEKEIRHPFKSTVRGELVRLLLVQIQKAKVDLELALTALDKLLRSNELNFALMAFIPVVAVLYGLVRGIYSGFGNRRLQRGLQTRANIRQLLQAIDRILTRYLHAQSASPRLLGTLVVEVAQLRLIATSAAGRAALVASRSNATQYELLEDIRTLEATHLTVQQKVRTWERLWREFS